MSPRPCTPHRTAGGPCPAGPRSLLPAPPHYPIPPQPQLCRGTGGTGTPLSPVSVCLSAEGHLLWRLCLAVPWHPAILCEKQQPSPNFSDVCENWRDLPPPEKKKKKRPGAGAFLGAENVKVKGEKLFGGSHHWLPGVPVQQRFQRDPLCHRFYKGSRAAAG